MLCTLVLNGVVDAMNEIPYELGKDFVNVTVSIDPEETPDLAAAKERSYLRAYRRGPARTGPGGRWEDGGAGAAERAGRPADDAAVVADGFPDGVDGAGLADGTAGGADRAAGALAGVPGAAAGVPGAADAAGGAADWHFLVGREANIRQLAEAVGFGYRYDPRDDQYIHTAVTILVTPNGQISRYLYGIEHPAQSFRLALLEAGEGKFGSALDRLILYCYHYDAAAGRYAPAALKVVRAGGVLTAIAVAVFLLVLRAGDARRRRRPLTPGAQS